VEYCRSCSYQISCEKLVDFKDFSGQKLLGLIARNTMPQKPDTALEIVPERAYRMSKTAKRDKIGGK
jgi:hypothetical protein